MGKGGKLRKLVRKGQAMSRLASRKCSSNMVAEASPDRHGEAAASSYAKEEVEVIEGGELREVYVGKSMRRYLIGAHLVDHPLLRVLSGRNLSHHHDAEEPAVTTVGCEVVLFDHLLWMLETTDPPPESLDELIEFYAC